MYSLCAKSVSSFQMGNWLDYSLSLHSRAKKYRVQFRSLLILMNISSPHKMCVCVCMKSLCVIHESSEWNNFMVNYIRLPLACSTRKCSLISIHAILMMNPMSHWFLMTIFPERNLEHIFRTCMMPPWGSNKIKIMLGL